MRWQLLTEIRLFPPPFRPPTRARYLLPQRPFLEKDIPAGLRMIFNLYLYHGLKNRHLVEKE